MKKLTNENGDVFGPFNSVEDHEHGFMCDGCLFPSSVTGTCSIATWSGGLPIAPMQQPPVPDSVPMAEARKVMRKAGVLDAIRSLVRAAGPDAEDDFEYQTRIRRHHPLVQAAIDHGILTAAKTDELFIEAAQLAAQSI